MIMSKLAIFNRNQLKYICAAGMVLDSLFFAFPGVFPVEFRLLSRYVAPLFAFFIAEGFRLSRNKEKYLIRLWIGGLVMVASQILSFFVLGAQNDIPDNIILTFAIAATALYFLDKEKSDGNHLPCFIIGCLLVVTCWYLELNPINIHGFKFWIEGGTQMTAVILIIYYIRDRRRAVLTYLIFDIGLILILGTFRMPSDYISISVWWETTCRYCDTYTFLFLPVLALYNGEKGSNKRFHRDFFYIFYPSHLWILQLLAILLGVRAM